MTTNNVLFEAVKLNDQLQLSNRIIMAPLTRSMADENLAPTELMAAYYARRADAGLIISEAILTAQEGQGYPRGPGIYTKQQQQAWQLVTERVHEQGGKIFAQLWHTGRVSHSIYHNGQVPIAPSAVALDGRVFQTDGLRYEVPREMTQADIKRVVQQFADAAERSLEAGFDGVEIHGANGYLIDQFLHWSSNQRQDQYGGNAENMMRFLFEVLDAIKAVVPEQRTGLRLLPYHAADIFMHSEPRDLPVFDLVLSELNQRQLAYLHKGMYEDDPIDALNQTVGQYIAERYSGIRIASGGYTSDTAQAAVKSGVAELVSFGRPFITHHDFVARLKQQQTIEPYDNDQLAELF
ncbi:alkene reductase [Neiella marina]|uniref:Alkene reductase n=1 Tax=Neiella marina TaxID=508461 RepID=A0A8J2XN97_9GAMM|nr:alkene reductase [Neiella marina]GGA66780.1 alkene reductase [Neiella marina]